MQPGILGRSTSLPQNAITKTTAITHYYADGTGGSDANDGLTALTPKLTLQAVFDLIPFLVEHVVYVHLTGSFDLLDTEVGLNKFVRADVRLIIDGGTNHTVIAGPYTADIHSTTSIGLTSLALTPDQYYGYWIKINDGPEAGKLRAITKHTADTFTPSYNFDGDPGLASFSIVRPATEITSSVPVGRLRVGAKGGEVIFTKLYFSGSSQLAAWYCDQVTLDGVIHAGWYCNGINCNNFSSFSWHYTDSGSYEYNGYELYNSFLMAGEMFSLVGAAPYSFAQGLFKNGVFVSGMGKYSGVLCGVGSSSLGPVIIEKSFMDYNIMKTTAGYAKTEIRNVTGVGLSLINSRLKIGSGFGISDCSSHAISMKSSNLELSAVIDGSGNAGAGAYVTEGSTIRTTSGSPPTLTGTVGDISTDGTSQASTWAAIEAGTPVADTTEMVTAKKV